MSILVNSLHQSIEVVVVVVDDSSECISHAGQIRHDIVAVARRLTEGIGYSCQLFSLLAGKSHANLRATSAKVFDQDSGIASMDSIAGFILAGGESRRMGTDKAGLTLNGQSFVDRIAAEVSTVTPLVSIVGSNAAALHLTNSIKFQIVPDVYPHWGALGGVHAALAACAAQCSAKWALIVACDFPLVTSDLFSRLASAREGFEAVAPIQSDSIPQPLCAFYRVAPCLARAEELIKSGERKPIALLQSVRTRWVLFSELADLKHANSLFDNINTPQDYARIARERN